MIYCLPVKLTFLLSTLSRLQFFSSCEASSCITCTIIPDKLVIVLALADNWLQAHMNPRSHLHPMRSIKPLMSHSFADAPECTVDIWNKFSFTRRRLQGGPFFWGALNSISYLSFINLKRDIIPLKPFCGVVTCYDSSTTLRVQRLSTAGCFSCLQSTIIADMRPTPL